jgi:predicted secreted hydrolase
MRPLAALTAALALTCAAVAPAAPPPQNAGGLLRGAPAAGFAQATAARTFSFPADHGPHEGYRQEWWYTSGNLESADQQRFGFELTFFRFALAPPAAPAPQASAWRAREIYMAHFAVTDAAHARFRYTQELARGALELAGATGAPLRVWLGATSLAADPADPDRWQLQAHGAGYDLDLTLRLAGAPVLNGEGGLSVKSAAAGDASYYYSLPRVAASGTLTRSGEPPLPVQGLVWVDREWGSGDLGAGQVGWDWFALQLDDGSALMFYALRRADGARDPHSGGTFTDPGGHSQGLAHDALAIEVTRSWVSPHGARYPGGWRLRAAALQLDLTLEPLLPDQELSGPPRYWEGAVQVRGVRAGRALGGRGYVELVGYGKER